MALLFRNQYDESVKRKKRGLFGPSVEDAIQGINPEEPTMLEGGSSYDLPVRRPEAPIPEKPSVNADVGIDENMPKKSKFSDFMAKFKDVFSAKNVQEPEDEYGLKGPIKEKAGVGKQILEYALPALIGLGGGIGIGPGLLAGMAKGGARRKDARESMEEYNKARAAAVEGIADRDLKEKQLESMDKYRKGSLAAKWAGLTGKNADEKALRIGQQLAKDPYQVSDDDLAWLNSYEKVKQTPKLKDDSGSSLPPGLGGE